MNPKASHSPRKLPTQARSRRTVDAILEAAAEVFEARGFDEATTEQIIARAGVSVGSMYQYFPNKSALVIALTERFCEDVQATQTAWLGWLAAEDPSLDAGLQAYIDWLVASHAVRPKLRCLLFDERPVPLEGRVHLHSTHAATVAGLEAWLTGKVVEPRVVASILHRMVPGLVHTLVLHPQKELPVERARREVFTAARAYLGAVALMEPVTAGS